MRTAVATIGTLIAICTFATATGQPKLTVVEGTKFTFGTMNRGAVVEHQVTLKNVGKESLHLGPIDASCGCTGAIASNEDLEPGQSTALTITFNSKNFTGAVRKTVTVRTSPAMEQAIVIEFTATIIDEITNTPQQFWYKDAEVGRKSRIVITIKNNGKEPLRLTGWRSQLAGFSMTLPSDPIAQGDSTQIVGEFTPQKVAPVISDAVFVHTSNPRRAELYFPVYGNAREFKFDQNP
jgi:hypothetical protein